MPMTLFSHGRYSANARRIYKERSQNNRMTMMHFARAYNQLVNIVANGGIQSIVGAIGQTIGVSDRTENTISDFVLREEAEQQMMEIENVTQRGVCDLHQCSTCKRLFRRLSQHKCKGALRCQRTPPQLLHDMQWPAFASVGLWITDNAG